MAEYEGTAPENGRNNGAQAGVVSEEPTIDRVKELLFGQEQRRTDDRIEDLKATILAVEQRLEEKIEALQSDIDRLDKSHAEELQTRLSGIGEAFEALGKTVSSVVGPKQ